MDSRKGNKFFWSIIGVAGYLLSPLSWWNDLYVNIPISYVFASIIGCSSKKSFMLSFTLMYWLTNILGIVMMHAGVSNTLTRKEKDTGKKILIKWLVTCTVYTGIMIALYRLGIFRPITDYLPKS
jgi:hypothetical protein